MGRDRRRQPQRIPLTRDIGNKARIRKRVDAQTYLLDIGSRVGSPAIGFYIGSLVLVEGELVLVTWREESDLYDIVGPVRQLPPAGPSSVFAAGFDASPYFTMLDVDSSGIVTDGGTAPADIPSATVERIEFSPDGQFLATFYADQLAVYAVTNGVLGALLDAITLPDTSAAAWHGGLSWSRNSDFLAAAFDNGSGDTVGVYGWDGATLTELHLEAKVAAFSTGTAAAWHPFTDHLAIGYSTATDGLSIYSWDGASLTFEDSVIPTAAGETVTDLQWNAAGDQILAAITQTPKASVVPWDGAAFGTPIDPAVAPAGLGRGIAFYPDESKIVLTVSGAGAGNQLAGWPWDGATFGTLVQTGGGTANGWQLKVDPTGTYVVVLHDNDASEYGTTYSFDGTTIAIIDDFGSVSGSPSARAGLAFPPVGVVTPTEQLDASEIVYGPDDETDWDVVPDDVAEALDELAQRLTDSTPLTGSLPLPIAGFVINTGTPALTVTAQWRFDATTLEKISGYFVIPTDYASGGFFRFHYRMSSATSGDVRWVVQPVLATVEGEDTSAAGDTFAVDDTVQGTAADMGSVDLTPTHTYEPGDVVRITLGRDGVHANDNATGDAMLLAVEFVYIPVGV